MEETMARGNRTRMVDEENVDPRTWGKGSKSTPNRPSAAKRRRSVLAADLQVDEIDGTGTRKRILTEILAEEMNGMRVQLEEKTERRSDGKTEAKSDRDPTEMPGTWTPSNFPRRPITRSVAGRDGFRSTPKSPTDLQWPVNLRKKALETALRRRQSLDSQATQGPSYSTRSDPPSPGAVESRSLFRK